MNVVRLECEGEKDRMRLHQKLSSKVIAAGNANGHFAHAGMGAYLRVTNLNSPDQLIFKNAKV